MQEKILIKKLDGTLEPFDEEKLRLSLDRSGASSETIDRIVKHVLGELREGMTTSHIYKHAFEILKKKKDSVSAARYSLKRAVMELGPTGFPFEKFVGEILKTKGYKITLGTMMEGACAPHEIDVLAEKEDKLLVIEAKFHNQLSVKSDLKVALYVKARYLDLEKSKFDGRLKPKQEHECWIVTNTDFTTNAFNYGKCAGMKIVGWSHPAGDNLQTLIEETALHPLTCLTTLSDSHKNALLKSGRVFCHDVKNNTGLLEKAGVKGSKLKAVLDEINQVCVPRK
jgi:hypothetical protein